MSKVLFIYSNGSTFTATNVAMSSFLLERSVDGVATVSYEYYKDIPEVIAPESLVGIDLLLPDIEAYGVSDITSHYYVNESGEGSRVLRGVTIDANKSGLAYVVITESSAGKREILGKQFTILPITKQLTLRDFPDMFKLANLLD